MCLRFHVDRVLIKTVVLWTGIFIQQCRQKKKGLACCMMWLEMCVWVLHFSFSFFVCVFVPDCHVLCFSQPVKPRDRRLQDRWWTSRSTLSTFLAGRKTSKGCWSTRRRMSSNWSRISFWVRTNEKRGKLDTKHAVMGTSIKRLLKKHLKVFLWLQFDKPLFKKTWCLFSIKTPNWGEKINKILVTFLTNLIAGRC